MCLSVPMKVMEIDGPRARCAALGEERWVDLTLMGDAPPKPGAYVQVSLGFAQREVPEADAQQAYELFGEILAALDAAG